MGIPPIENLVDNVLEAETALTRTMTRDGRHATEYRDALKRFAVAWFVLEKSRQPQEFIPQRTASLPAKRFGSALN